MSAPALLFIAQLAALVGQQQGKDAREVRDLDRRIETLSSQASALGYQAAAPLARAAADPSQPLKLRLWLVASLESLRDPAAFGPLSDLALDPSSPDLLREAALRAVAASDVSARARRQTLCATLDARPGSASLAEALFELRSLGCEEVATLEVQAAPGHAHPDWAIAALASSHAPAAVDALDETFRRHASGSPGRLAALEALRARARELTPRRHWADRAASMAQEEDGAPANAVAALRLVAALGEPSAARAAIKLLGSRDGAVVVAAAETLAALHDGAAAPEVQKIYAGYLQDPRFAAGAGRDPVGWYDRLGAALKALPKAP